jgi:hypothetical protein
LDEFVSQTDEQLYQLIQEILQHEDPRNLRRLKALNRLIILMQRQPGLYRSVHQDYSQALNRTWEWFSQNLAKFELNQDSTHLGRRLVIWINGYLKWRITDLYSPDSKAPLSLDATFSPDEDSPSLLDKLTDQPLNLLDELIEKLQTQERERFGQQVRQAIAEDPDRLLTHCQPRNAPTCNCHELARRLLLTEPPETIATIAQTLNFNQQTLYSHWKRKCLPLLKEIAQKYQP